MAHHYYADHKTPTEFFDMIKWCREATNFAQNIQNVFVARFLYIKTPSELRMVQDMANLFQSVLYIYEAVADSIVDTFKIKYPKINFVCTDISFLTNRAAVYLERDKYEECMKDCNTVLERGKRL